MSDSSAKLDAMLAAGQISREDYERLRAAMEGRLPAEPPPLSPAFPPTPLPVSAASIPPPPPVAGASIPPPPSILPPVSAASPSAANNPKSRSICWQWVIFTIAMAIEGIDNLTLIPNHPLAAIWLAAKIVMIVGLYRRSLPIYLTTVLVGFFHVVTFASMEEFGAAVTNLVLMLVLLTGWNHFTANRWVRSARHRVLGGVCGGLAERTNLTPKQVRILAVLLLLVFQAALVIAYVILWNMLPREQTAANRAASQPAVG